ncbi:DIS3-like exonuclease 2 [Lycorma delicatula]|uniref:DIS3-like exonuclease 2 n=1 Tax=Lycorma delicatula TaxID=130591 RepID=UPI003F519F85
MIQTELCVRITRARLNVRWVGRGVSVLAVAYVITPVALDNTISLIKTSRMLSAQKSLLSAIEKHFEESKLDTVERRTEKSVLTCEVSEHTLPLNVNEVSSSKPRVLVEEESKKKINFNNYLTEEEVKAGLENKTLFEGYFRINRKNNSLAYVITKKEKKKIFLKDLYSRNRALDGDVVVVKILEENVVKSNNPETDNKNKIRYVYFGEVVFIKKINRRRVTVAVLSHVNKNNATLISRDQEMPYIIVTDEYIQKIGSVEKDLLYKVHINSWESLKCAEGEILECLGKIGEVEAETRAAFILCGCERIPYPCDFNKYYPDPSTFKIPSEEYTSREDLRNVCIFTIDSTLTSDLDDALSVKELSNGNYEIGVHIADVSYFIEPKTPFDDVLKMNGTSIYLKHETYHLLPDELVDLISLTPGEDKLVISVFWEIDADGNIISNRFARCIINSCVKLAYEDVQEILQEDKGNLQNQENSKEIFGEFKISDCIKNIKTLYRISNKLELKRSEKGFLCSSKVELQYSFDPITKHPKSLKAFVKNDVLKMIEEFMLLANKTVASQLFDVYPEISLFRKHSHPNVNLMSELKTLLFSCGVDIDINSCRSLCKSLLKYKKNEIMILVLSKLIILKMTGAKYCSVNDNSLHHYALNVPLYTHFTSPIRRYADIVNHRLLAASIGYTEKPDWSHQYVMSLAKTLNKSSNNASCLETTMEKFFLQLYIKNHGSLILRCAVIEIHQYNFTVVSLEYGFHVQVFTDILNGLSITLNYNDYHQIIGMNLLWQDGTVQKISIFTELFIEVLLGNFHTLEGKLIPPTV